MLRQLKARLEKGGGGRSERNYGQLRDQRGEAHLQEEDDVRSGTRGNVIDEPEEMGLDGSHPQGKKPSRVWSMRSPCWLAALPLN